MGRQHHDLDAFGQKKFRADDEMNAALLRFDMRSDDARQRTFIGDRDAAITELRRLRHQFVGVRCAVQKTEIALAVQLGKNVRRNSHG